MERILIVLYPNLVHPVLLVHSHQLSAQFLSRSANVCVLMDYELPPKATLGRPSSHDLTPPLQFPFAALEYARVNGPLSHYTAFHSLL